MPTHTGRTTECAEAQAMAAKTLPRLDFCNPVVMSRCVGHISTVCSTLHLLLHLRPARSAIISTSVERHNSLCHVGKSIPDEIQNKDVERNT